MQFANWKISKIIIFDKNFKFISNFWIVFFVKLNIILLMNNVYYSQIDELSKRFNQTIEIVLRYLISKNFDIDWFVILSTLQTQLNNVVNATIDKFSNEIIYEFKLRDVFIALINKSNSMIDLDFERFQHQREIANVMFYVMTKTKIFYDSRHISMLFKINDKVFFRLYKNYTLFSKLNVKLSN